MLFTKGENFSIYCNVTKTQGGAQVNGFFFHSTFVERYTSIGQVFDLITHKMSRIKIWNFCKYTFLGKTAKTSQRGSHLALPHSSSETQNLNRQLPPPTSLRALRSRTWTTNWSATSLTGSLCNSSSSNAVLLHGGLVLDAGGGNLLLLGRC